MKSLDTMSLDDLFDRKLLPAEIYAPLQARELNAVLKLRDKRGRLTPEGAFKSLYSLES